MADETVVIKSSDVVRLDPFQKITNLQFPGAAFGMLTRVFWHGNITWNCTNVLLHLSGDWRGTELDGSSMTVNTATQGAISMDLQDGLVTYDAAETVWPENSNPPRGCYAVGEISTPQGTSEITWRANNQNFTSSHEQWTSLVAKQGATTVRTWTYDAALDCGRFTVPLFPGSFEYYRNRTDDSPEPA